MCEAVNIVVNPLFSKTNWFFAFVKGVRSVCESINIIYYEDNLNDVFMQCEKNGGCAILVSSSLAWETKIISYFSKRGINLVIIRPTESVKYPHCSSVSLNYFQTAFEIMKYFIETGGKRIAFFALNTDATQDMLKFDAYKYAISLSDINFSENDIYINYGDLNKCVEKFSKNANLYDCVLCANDAAAIALVRKLKKQNLNILAASFGSTSLLKLLWPEVISASLNFEKAGACAADLYLYILKSGGEICGSYTIESDIQIPSPKKRIKSLKTADLYDSGAKEIAFYSDPVVKEVFDIENALALLDELEIKIIKSIMGGLSYEKTAEKTSSSVTTVKYHLKKIFSVFNASDKTELLKILGKYFT